MLTPNAAFCDQAAHDCPKPPATHRTTLITALQRRRIQQSRRLTATLAMAVRATPLPREDATAHKTRCGVSSVGQCVVPSRPRAQCTA